MADADVILTPDQSLDIIARTTDENWFRGMDQQPDGSAILAMASAIAAATSAALDEQVAACKISDAPTGSPGRCDLIIRRQVSTSSADPNVVNQTARAFASVPAAPAGGATVVMFADFARQAGGSGAVFQSTYARSDGTPLAITPDAVKAVTLVFHALDQASAANGLRAYLFDSSGTWVETDLKDGTGAPTIGAGAPVQVPALSAGQEWARRFDVSGALGFALEFTAGATPPSSWSATVSVEYQRQEVTVLPDTVIATIPRWFKFVTNIGVELVVATDVAVLSGQADVLLPLQTLRQIDLVNTRANAFDDILDPGDGLDAIISPDSTTVLDNNGFPILGLGVEIFSYLSSSPVTGATMDWLSEHGNERGCRRQPGEDGEAYRARVRQIPDAVTPTAIQEAVAGAQSQGKLPSVYMVEPYRDQSSDNARAEIGLIFADAPYCDDGATDDPFGVDVAGKRPLRTLEVPSLREGRAYFRESMVGQLKEPDGLVMYADASYADDSSWGYPDVGQHPTIEASLRAIVDEAEAKRAGGVQFDVMVEDAKVLFASAQATDPSGVVSWTLAADAGKAWIVRDGFVNADVYRTSAIAPATDSFLVRFTLEDGSVVTTGWVSDPSGIPIRFKQMQAMGYFATWITMIEGLVRSSAGHNMNLVGIFWVTERTA